MCSVRSFLVCVFRLWSFSEIVFEAMNRDSAQKLSDSDFWQICREMHPSTNYTFPVAPMLGVANNDDNLMSNLESVDQRLGFDQHETSEEASSDDSLQNLYVKKSRAHRKLLSTNSNCINTKKILDTIELFSDEDEMDGCVESVKNGKMSDESHNNDINHDRNKLTLSKFERSDIDGIHNADDLLLKIADSVQQLKANVNQMSELNDKCQTSSDAYAVGDLIDFSDDWTNGESDNNSNTSDKPIKKVTHSCVQGKSFCNFHFNISLAMFILYLLFFSLFCFGMRNLFAFH